MTNISLNKPLSPDLKKLYKYLESINDRQWYTNFGPLHNELEERLSDYLGVQNLLLVANATLGLQVAGNVLNSQALVATPYSFGATVSAYKWQNKSIFFSDVDHSSCNLSVDSLKAFLERGERIDTILATHVYGNPCDVAKIDQLAEQYGCKVIYDAAHSFGVDVAGHSLLSYGDASVLSFHATKLFHTGEGGAVIFKKAADYETAKLMINFGIAPGKATLKDGINAKMSEYHAAIGLVNLQMIDEVIEHRVVLFETYRSLLGSVVALPKWHQDANFNGAYMPVAVPTGIGAEAFVQCLADVGIQSRRYFYPSLDTLYCDEPSDLLPYSHGLADSMVCLPLHYYMSVGDVEHVCSAIKSILK